MSDTTKEYVCQNCESEFKIIFPITQGVPTNCPFCGANIEEDDGEETQEEQTEDWED